MLSVIMIATSKTKAIWIKPRATEEATTDKMVMAPINLRIGQHRVDQSKIFKLTITKTKFNMINMVMLVIKIKIDFKITLINSSSSNRSNHLQTIIILKLFMKIQVLEEPLLPTPV